MLLLFIPLLEPLPCCTLGNLSYFCWTLLILLLYYFLLNVLLLFILFMLFILVLNPLRFILKLIPFIYKPARDDEDTYDFLRSRYFSNNSWPTLCCLEFEDKPWLLCECEWLCPWLLFVWLLNMYLSLFYKEFCIFDETLCSFYKNGNDSI